MTEKRFEVTFNDSDFHLSDNETGEELKLVDEKVYYDYIANRWNALHEENNELRLMLNSCSDQRNEFHRGARENANRVGKLERENEQLKQELWDISIDYFTETYSDNSIRRDEHINEFKKEFKAKYGDVE